MASKRARHHWPGDDPSDALLRSMYDEERDTMHFQVHRGREFYEEGTSFSREAMEDVNQMLAMWPWARLMRRWDQSGQAPQNIEIEVTVRFLDGKDNDAKAGD